MQTTVDGVSKTGLGFIDTSKNWYNRGKKADFENFSALKKGDVVEFEPMDGKWVNSYKVTGSGPAKSSAPAGSGKTYTAASGSDKDAVIARSVAVKAALENFGVNLTSEKDQADTYSYLKGVMRDVAAYVQTGEFPSDNKGA